jgi:chromosome segregation ATPase
MRALFRNLLAGAGLATAAQAAHARQAADTAEQRAAALRADLERWKARHHEASSAAAESRKAAAQAQAAAERAQRDLERAQRDVEQWKARSETRGAQVREFRERFTDTRRVATVAREHVMAIETKLDLVEAAIQVLDARTRERSLTR